jgi:hypothetical protein
MLAIPLDPVELLCAPLDRDLGINVENADRAICWHLNAIRN